MWSIGGRPTLVLVVKGNLRSEPFTRASMTF